jgi:predicted extracellular nuclease
VKKYYLPLTILICILIISACGRTPTPIPTGTAVPTPTSVEPEPTETFELKPGDSPIVISEVLAGIQGNNNYEFIELYNRSTDPVDLQGWSIWYRLPTSQEDIFVYRWTGQALVPPSGHYILAHTGEDIGIPVNAEFEQALNTTKGGIQLRQTDGNILDALGWGEASEGFYEGSVAQAMENGISLERAPGKELGNSIDNNDNSVDFSLNPSPMPQNTGSSLTPFEEDRLEVSIIAPEAAMPGSQYDYYVDVINLTDIELEDIVTIIPIPSEMTVDELSDNMSVEEGYINWQIDSMSPDGSEHAQITVSVPWTYFTALISNYYVQSDNWLTPAFGEPVQTSIEGGVIPIGTSRTLLEADLTIEGIATMYTGGYYAGGGNTKFYLEDETGGLQVQVFEGEGSVNVNIGSRVRVRGTIGAYRGAKQIVPILVPDDVEILAPPGDDQLIPELVSIIQAATDKDNLPGRLIQVEGVVTRVEEFAYNYEIDLADENLQPLTLYVDKLTNINVEQIEEGHSYQASGIIEIRDDTLLLYPRIQSDLERIYPPELRLETDAPNTIADSGIITYTITAFNHTAAPLTGVIINAVQPVGTSIAEIFNLGVQEGSQINWRIDELLPNGGNQSVRFTVVVGDQVEEQVIFESASASATEWTETVSGPSLLTFVGDSVPIWAIQGDGFRSPYVFDTLATEGIVTGIFPELSGFFIQETSTDDDPLTSAGLFITSLDPVIDVKPGDYVNVSGLVREPSGQTTVQITDMSDVSVISEGNSLPFPEELDPPTLMDRADIYNESVEGMLVQVTGPSLAVSPTSKYGEYVLVLPYHNQNRLYQGEDNGIAIMVDDGSSTTHYDNSTMTYSVTTGDEVSDLVGPLAYTFGRYKIEPIVNPTVVTSGITTDPIEEADQLGFSIMTWNVENLFDTRDPHPSDPPRPRLAEYQRDLNKVANTIIAGGSPTIIAFQEVENIGVLEELADHPLISDFDYTPVLVEGFDSRGIDVGYLVRGDRATVLSQEQRDAPEGLTSRPPLVLEVDIQTDSGPVTLLLINNHFTSMSGGEEATEPRRTAQAAWNVTILEEIQSDSPDAYVTVLGDLNSFYDSLPIQTLRDAGLEHTYDTLHDKDRYNYIYQGESQVLDHVLVTSSLMELLESVYILHVNADFPLQAPDDVSSIRKSDHDPVVVVFSLG